jgi:basic membrane protein A and related proteins
VTNTQDKYPDTLVVSALWNVEPTLVAALRALADGHFRAEDYGKYSTLKYKGSELSPLGTFQTKVPVELMARVKKREQQILDGKFRVHINDREPRGTRR